jgi:hypothetical protein
MTLQIRMEAFNILNHPNFTPPNSTPTASSNAVAPTNSASFGQIISDITGNSSIAGGGDPRILQAAMKFVF